MELSKRRAGGRAEHRLAIHEQEEKNKDKGGLYEYSIETVLKNKK